MKAQNRRRTTSWAWMVLLVFSLLACGSRPVAERTNKDAEPLVVQQLNAMRSLRDWGSANLHVTWSDGMARIANESDQAIFCGASSTEVSYQPDHYFGIRTHQAREIPIPHSPIVRCLLDW